MFQQSKARRGALAITSVLALASLAACGGSDDESGSDDEIVVGISLPLTGDFSEPGKGVQRGYEAWADYVNENGGILDREVRLEILDDQSNADRVTSDYEKLISSDEVDMVFGPFSTLLVVPAATVAEEYGYAFIEPAGAAPEVFEQGFKNLFYAAPAVADDHYNLLAEKVLSLPEDQKPKTVAYASMDDPFAQGTAYGLKDQLEEAGIETVADEVYPPNTTSFDSVAAKIKGSKADMLVVGSQYQDGVNLIKALQQLDYQPKIAAVSGAPTNPEFTKAVGGASEGVLAPTGYTPAASYPENKTFVEHYKSLHDGELPAEDEANAWTVGEVAKAAIEAVECADGSPECQEQIVDWLHENEVDTVVGPLSWDEDGRPQSAHMIQQYVDGEIKIVLPEDQAEADFIPVKPEW